MAIALILLGYVTAALVVNRQRHNRARNYRRMRRSLATWLKAMAEKAMD